MNNNMITDAPIDNPDHDLLGMKSHAEMLAQFIAEVTPPFIIGVYGQWGEGKTSYVELTKKYLEQYLREKEKQNKEKGLAPKENENPVVFIRFSAWPYTTSDELWRALTFAIARKICNPNSTAKSPVQPEETSKPEPGNFLELISRFLMEDALVLWHKLEPQQPKNTCADLGISLNEGLSRSISRRSERQLEINQEAAFMAILNSALAAIGSISPMLAGLRGFLGLNQEIKLSEIIQEKKGKITQENLDSIPKLKEALIKLFDEKATNKIVVVFIDDLDRCLPDVALDLLEAIKIFFADVKCIFLVAADKNLIGQGLRLRYKDLFDLGDPQKTEELLTRKGDEYFEKVVQFGVRVPQRTPKQVHKFISAQYPQWLPTTDIIATAIGNNPRRLKQYCSILSFTYDASHRSSGVLDD